MGKVNSGNSYNWLIRTCCFLFTLVVILNFSFDLFAATQPDILSTKINGSSVGSSANITINPGESFTFYIEVENNGDDSPAGYNNITISFPSLNSSTYKANVTYTSKSSDLTCTEYFGSEAGGGDGYADYVMIEAVDNDGWDGSDYLSAENNDITLSITPVDS